MPTPLHGLLAEESLVAKRDARLVAGRSEGLEEILFSVDEANTASAAARRRLYDQRVANALGLLERILGTHQGATAPGRNRHPSPLGELLGCNLVAEVPHGGRRWAEEDDALALESLDEAGILCHESPAGPHRVRVRALQRFHHAIVVEIGGDRTVGRGEQDRLIGVPNEGRITIHVGVDRDGVDVTALARTQRFGRAQTAHRRLAAVYDGESAQRTACRAHEAHLCRALAAQGWRVVSIQQAKASQSP